MISVLAILSESRVDADFFTEAELCFFRRNLKAFFKNKGRYNEELFTPISPGEEENENVC
jgi:hypothetical protein